MITIDIPIYYSRLHIFLNKEEYDRRKVKRCVSNWFVKEADYNNLTNEFHTSYEKSIVKDSCGGVTIFNSGLYFIALKEYDSTPKKHSILIHELLHVVFEVLRSRNIVETNDSTEAYTYFMEWLTEETMEQINRRNENISERH